jgi:hypothetical protein
MTSKMLYVAGMKTESEFADVYLDFIRKYGIPTMHEAGSGNSSTDSVNSGSGPDYQICIPLGWETC